MSSIIIKDYEISNYSDEYDWEDAQEVARMIVDSRGEGADYCVVEATNLNWQGRSGMAIFDVRDDFHEELWSKIAGWKDAEWTLRIKEVLEPTGLTKVLRFEAVAYSHDTPTGGSRTVEFLTGWQVANLYLLDGTIKRLNELKEYFNVDSKQELYNVLDGNHFADEVQGFIL